MTDTSSNTEQTVLVISSGKGGVGKSLLAACLRAVLSDEYRVLLIDMDLSVKGLTFMHDTADAWQKAQGSLMSYLAGEINATDVIEAVIERGGPPIVPAATDFASPVNWNQYYGREPQHDLLLGQLVNAAFAAGFNILIFDTRAGIDGLLLAVAEVAHKIIVEVEPDEISLTAALDMRGQIKSREGKLYFLVNKAPGESTGKPDPILKALRFLPPIPFEFRLYNRFVKDARGLVRSEFRGTSFRRYVGRVAKTLFPRLPSAEIPLLLDTLLTGRALRLVIPMLLAAAISAFITALVLWRLIGLRF